MVSKGITRCTVIWEGGRGEKKRFKIKPLFWKAYRPFCALQNKIFIFLFEKKKKKNGGK